MDAIDAYERWAYGEGWSAGLLEGRRQGFEEGYGAGFDAGAEIGAARVLLGLQHAVDISELNLLPGLPHTGEYASHLRRTKNDNEPCPYGCGACSRCVRAANVARNLALYGTPDYPGSSSVHKGRCP